MKRCVVKLLSFVEERNNLRKYSIHILLSSSLSASFILHRDTHASLLLEKDQAIPHSVALWIFISLARYFFACLLEMEWRNINSTKFRAKLISEHLNVIKHIFHIVQIFIYLRILRRVKASPLILLLHAEERLSLCVLKMNGWYFFLNFISISKTLLLNLLYAEFFVRNHRVKSFWSIWVERTLAAWKESHPSSRLQYTSRIKSSKEMLERKLNKESEGRRGFSFGFLTSSTESCISYPSLVMIKFHLEFTESFLFSTKARIMNKIFVQYLSINFGMAFHLFFLAQLWRNIKYS